MRALACLAMSLPIGHRELLLAAILTRARRTEYATVTSSQSAAAPGPDAADPAENESFSLASIESIARAAVKAAAYPDRWALWEAYQLAVKDVAASSVEYPWQAPEEITRISARAAVRVLMAMLEAVDDPAEKSRLAKIITREAERVEQEAEASGEHGAAIPAGKHPIRRCASCGEPYRPQRARSTYCSHRCKQAAYRARQAQRRPLREAARWRHPA